MKNVLLLTFLVLPFHSNAQQLQAPFARPDIPVTGRDRSPGELPAVDGHRVDSLEEVELVPAVLAWARWVEAALS